MSAITKIRSVLIFSLLGLIALVVVFGLAVISSIPFALTRNFDAGIGGAAPSRLVIERVDVLPMSSIKEPEQPLLRDRWVVIEGRKIMAVRETAPKLLPGDQRIDGRGMTLMPGLIDMHVHVFDRTDLLLYLAHGVTTVRNMMGFEMHQRWRRELEMGVYPGPRLISASPTLNQNSNAPFHKYVSNSEEARTLVKRYADKGYDLIKIYEGLEPDVFRSIVDEAQKAGLPVAGHLPNRVSFSEALGAGLVSIEHVEEIYQGPMKRFRTDAPTLDNVVQEIKTSGVPVTPTLSAFRNLARAAEEKEAFVTTVDRDFINPLVNFFGDRAMADPLSREDPGPYSRAAGRMAEITYALYEADAPLLLGTDTGPSLTIPGQTTLDEIDLLAEVGLTPYDIIASGTLVAADALGLRGEIGRIAPGYRADLVLVNGDPLTDLQVLRSPEAVIQGGAYYDAGTLEALKTRARDNMSLYETLGWFLHHEFTK